MKGVVPEAPWTAVSAAPPGSHVHSVSTIAWSGAPWAATTAQTATRKERKTVPAATRPMSGLGAWWAPWPPWSS